MLAGGLRLLARVLGSPVGSWVQEGRDAVPQPGWLTRDSCHQTTVSVNLIFHIALITDLV